MRNVVVEYRIRRTLQNDNAVFRAVDDVSFSVARRSCFGIVGESGSGKSTLVRTLVGLQRPNGGFASIDGIDVHRANRSEKIALHRKVQMVFQDAGSSLNPRLTIGQSLEDPLVIQRRMGKSQRNRLAAEWLGRVGLAPNDATRYPHELSGGQRQRACIARALITQPDLLVCDEPVSALDVSIQAQILMLMQSLQIQLGLTIVFVSHALGVVRTVCDHVAVMQKGKIVESAAVETLFQNPTHPYTQALLEACCDLD